MKEMLVLEEGEKMSYQDLLELRVGQFIARALPYNENIERISDNDNGILPEDAFFEGDADYSIKIIKHRK
jgi:hypothetical protein